MTVLKAHVKNQILTYLALELEVLNHFLPWFARKKQDKVSGLSFHSNRFSRKRGHKEPCVSRVVKRSGPNLGRQFYVRALAEGPASNPEVNCGFFQKGPYKIKDQKMILMGNGLSVNINSQPRKPYVLCASSGALSSF